MGTANGKTSSKTIKNTYKNSYVWQILDDSNQQVLWQTNTVNASGQLLTADLGNGIAITNDYDIYGFTAKFKHDKTSSSPANIMTLTTTFEEKKGNLKSRNNNMFNWTEDFTTSYDNLDRLTSYKNAQGAIENQNYDDRGRITQNNLGTYNYTSTAKAYQNTSVTLTDATLPYYLNRQNQNISYNTFKSPVEIIEDGIDRISFTYNESNDRSAMFYGSTNPDKTLRPNRKYYSADGSMEIKITPTSTEFVTYIGGDGYSAPIVLKSDGTTQNYLYLHRDYQGSILAITDANAPVVAPIAADDVRNMSVDGGNLSPAQEAIIKARNKGQNGGGDIFAQTYGHFQTGGGTPLNISTSSLDFGGITQKNLTYNSKTNTYGLDLYKVNPMSQTALALGKISLVSKGNNQYSIEPDYYDFNIEWNNGFTKRNIATFGAGALHYGINPIAPFYSIVPLIFGGPFWINFNGTVRIKP